MSRDGEAVLRPPVLGLTAAVAAIYRWWIPIEERHLGQIFGPSYLHYRDQTPRWL